MKKNGYTLVELLAIVTVLSIIIGLSASAFSQVQNSVLNKDYDNIKTYIETSAEQFASETGIYGTVSVLDLIEAGFVTPDDNNDKIYNPVNNEDITCHKVLIEYVDDEFSATYDEEHEQPTNDETGKCNSTETQQALEICEYIDESTCNTITDNTWFKDQVTIGVKQGNDILGATSVFSWNPSASITPTIVVKSNSSVQVYVMINGNSLNTGSASKYIQFDKTGPVYEEIKSSKIYYKDTESGVDQICFYSGTERPTTCDELTNCGSVTAGTETGVSGRTIPDGVKYACAIDKVGNKSAKVKTLPFINLEMDLANSTVDTTNSSYYTSIVLKGTALEEDKGIKSYAFTTSSSTPSSWTNLGSITKTQITQTTTVTENGTYYFWVKYGDDTTAKKSITVDQINPLVNTIDVGVDLANSTVDPTNSSYYTSITLKGTAQHNKLGIKAYAFTNSSSTPSSWTTLSSTIKTQITQSTSVTENGTYYFWVKYGDDTTNKKSVSVTQITPSVNTIDVAIDTSSSTYAGDSTTYYTAIKLKGTARNNTKGIKAYAFTTSSSTPASSKWTTITQTNDMITKTSSATSNTTYYFWVKYGDNTTAKKSITIDKLVTSASTTLDLYSESSSTITGNKTISGIVALGNVTVDNGSVSSSSLNGTKVTVKVTGGTKNKGTRNETVEDSSYLSSSKAKTRTVCTSCSAGTPSGSGCVGSKGSSYTLETPSPVKSVFKCSYSKYVKDTTEAPSTSCASGYKKGTNVTYYSCGSATSCSSRTALSDKPSNVYTGKACTSDLTVYWIGSTTCTFNGTCTDTDTEYYCSSGVLSGTKCYSCSSGTVSTSGPTCKITSKVTYYYYDYTVTINYYKLKS